MRSTRCCATVARDKKTERSSLQMAMTECAPTLRDSYACTALTACTGAMGNVAIVRLTRGRYDEPKEIVMTTERVEINPAIMMGKAVRSGDANHGGASAANARRRRERE